MLVRTPDDAFAFLDDLGAPRRLVLHHELVVEAARELVAGVARITTSFDTHLVLLGAALHDAGKIFHPQELDHPGSNHEPAGRDLLHSHGLTDLARFCITHASWSAGDTPLEDLLVALADKLWKGKRVADLERRVVDRLCSTAAIDFWNAFVIADDLFERIAARGDERLARSR